MSETKTINKPLVSVLCTTYNHVKYIREALDSILEQETNFEFEVLINDDASTDGTTQIIREYEKKHPRTITAIYHEDNQYQKGVRHMMAHFLLPRVKGKYIAICEGDDYWTDPKKLQKQVNCLESNKDCSICFHPVEIKHENGNQKDTTFPEEMQPDNFTINRLIKSNFIHTNSVMYRTQENYKDIKLNMHPGDWYLHLYHAQFGEVCFIDEVMSIYRRHKDSMWSSRFKNETTFWRNHGARQLAFYNEVHSMFEGDKEKKDSVKSNIADALEAIYEYSEADSATIIEESISLDDTGVISLSVSSLIGRIQQKEGLIKEIDRQLKDQHVAIKQLQGVLQARGEEIKNIKASRVWTVRNFIAKLLGREVV